MTLYRDFSYQAFRFISGSTDDRPQSDNFTLKRFIDWRSRVPELRQMKMCYPTISFSRYTKSELIEFFCNLQASKRWEVLKTVPDIIVVMPADCREFKIERPKAIASRSACFGGKTVEYDVYTVVDFLGLIEKQLSVKQG